jgi:hypothetical protein
MQAPAVTEEMAALVATEGVVETAAWGAKAPKAVADLTGQAATAVKAAMVLPPGMVARAAMDQMAESAEMAETVVLLD